LFFFFQAEDGIRDKLVTGVQTCALPIWIGGRAQARQDDARRGPPPRAPAPAPPDGRRDVAGRHPGRRRRRRRGDEVAPRAAEKRSEERRVGKERWSEWGGWHVCTVLTGD